MTNVYNRLIEIGIILLVIFTPIYYGSADLGAIALVELTILIMLLICALEMVVQGSFVFRRTPLDIAILLFCAYSVISTFLFSEYTHASYMGLLLILCISVLYFIVANHIRSRTQLARLSVAIVLVGSVHAFSHLARNAAELLGFSTGAMLNVGNHFAGYMVIVIPLAVAMSFVVKDIGKRILLIFASIIMAAAMTFSLIAGAMLAFLFSLALIALLFAGSENTRKQALVLGSIILCLLLIVFWIGYRPVFKELLTLTNLRTGSPAGRLSLWKSSFAMFADNPIAGTGLGTFDYIYPGYRLPDVYGRAVYAHSDWLQLLTELGIVGSIIILLGAVLFFMLILKRSDVMKLRGGLVKGLVVGGLSSVGVGLLHALVEFNFHIPAIAVLFTIVVALTVVAASSYARDGRAIDPSSNGKGDVLISDLPQWKIHIRSPVVRIASFICVFLLISFFAVLILRPCIADVYYQSGMKLEEDLFWDDAADKYQSAIGLSRSNSDYLYALGNVYAKRARLTKGTDMQRKWGKLALDAYCQAIELCPANGDYYLVLGNLYEVLENVEGAEAAYMKSISLDPNNAFYHETYGTFCLKQGEVQNAIAEYRKALEVYPKDLHDILDTIYWTLDSSSVEHRVSLVKIPAYAREGVKHRVLSIGREICPQGIKSYVNLARFFEGKGWYDDAFSEYRRAIALAPKRIDLWKRSSSLLVQQGKFEEAAALWQQFLKSHPQNAEAYVQLAIVYVRQKRLGRAIQQYLIAADTDPDNSGYLIKAADLYMQKGESAEAVKLWRTAIQRNPYQASAYSRLGKYYENQGDWIGALKFFRRAIEAEPENVWYRSDLANSYYKKGLFYEAIQEWERALKLQPADVLIRLQLARIHRQLRRDDEAKEHYGHVLKLQPENIEAQRAVLGTEVSQAALLE